jgi:hypothetical protein
MIFEHQQNESIMHGSQFSLLLEKICYNSLQKRAFSIILITFNIQDIEIFNLGSIAVSHISGMMRVYLFFLQEPKVTPWYKV